MNRYQPSIEFIHTENFPALLSACNVSLLATTYQARKLLCISPAGGKLSMLMRTFPRPTGLAVRTDHMALCSKHQIIAFDRVHDLRDSSGNLMPHDICLTPRTSFITGDILGHEITYLNDQIYFISTRFNAICRTSLHRSFEPVWRPSFITELVAEDRCHLNGFAVEAETIKYVTCVAKTNQLDAWRKHRKAGGTILNFPNSEVVSHGISMPHSPRISHGELWVLNSGRGMVEVVDPQSGKRNEVVKLPGFLRGLAFTENYAFVGLSQLRENAILGGLEIEQLSDLLECAIYCIDRNEGSVVGFIRFTRGITELFDVQILSNSTNPHLVGLEDGEVDRIFSL